MLQSQGVADESADRAVCSGGVWVRRGLVAITVLCDCSSIPDLSSLCYRHRGSMAMLENLLLGVSKGLLSNGALKQTVQSLYILPRI
jgi:hypothetical protein